MLQTKYIIFKMLTATNKAEITAYLLMCSDIHLLLEAVR